MILVGHCALAPILYVLGVPEFREKVLSMASSFKNLCNRRVVPVPETIPGGSSVPFPILPEPLNDNLNLPTCPPCTPDGFFDPYQGLPDFSNIICILNDLPNPSKEIPDHPPDIRNNRSGDPECPPNTPADLSESKQNLPDYFGKAIMKILVKRKDESEEN